MTPWVNMSLHKQLLVLPHSNEKLRILSQWDCNWTLGASETFHLSELDLKTAGMPDFPIQEPSMKRNTAGQQKLSLLHTEQKGTPHTCWTWSSFDPSTCQRADRPFAGSWMWMCSFRRLAHSLLLLSCPLWCHSLSFLPLLPVHKERPPASAPPTLAGVLNSRGADRKDLFHDPGALSHFVI